MPTQWKTEDAVFHMRRSEAERRASLRSSCSESEGAHRHLALEHEIAALNGTKPDPGASAFDEAEFLRFVLRVTYPV